MRFSLLIRHVLLVNVACGFAASGQLIREANTTLNLPADLPSATGYITQNALGSLTFAAPMIVTSPPGETNRLFVAERGGTIQVVNNLSTTPAKGAVAYFSLTSILTAGQTLRNDGENGFLSLVFHPDFATNGTFFVYFSIEVGTVLYQRLHQVSVTNPAASTATIFSHKPLLTILDRDTNHNGGDLHFGADGFLYLSTGDEGGGGDNRNNARFINHRLDPSGTPNRVTRTGFWGQMLRLAVEVDPKTQPGVFPAGSVAPNTHTQNSATFPTALHGNYRVPADNPFHGYTLWHSVAVDPLTVRTEIYATGLRNPFRWSFDPPTGRLFLADVGQGIWEEVNIIAKGNDMGWSWREGNHQYFSPPSPTTPPAAPAPGAPAGTGFTRTDPIYEYDHTNDGSSPGGNPDGGPDAVISGTSITGGMVYRGNRLTELYGAYIFADYNSGFIVALREQANGTWTGTRLFTDNNISDFGADPRNGDVLFCDLGSGTVKRLARSGTTGTNPPALLSQTGAFSSLANLTPNAGIVAYDVNVPFWSDYATKTRWFSIKSLVPTFGFSADGNWTLPTGTTWIKHFDIETTRDNPATKRKLETRILVKTATDIYGLSYRWRADQSDADLVTEEGLSELIPTSSPAQTWRYPSRAECRACHTGIAGFALSFNTRQLNRTHPYGLQTTNQISAFGSAGYLAAPVANVHTLPAFVPATDGSKSLEARVRSYLAVNCVQCHQPGGTATGSWDARPTTPTDSAQIINGVLANTYGDPLNRFAVPNDVAHSMVIERLQGNGAPRMPPLITNEVDPMAIQLLSAWITQDLPTRQSFAQWQTANFGSPGAPNAAPGDDPDGDGGRNDFEFLARTGPLTPGARFVLGLQTLGSNYQLTFEQPANRALVIETTTDFNTWSLWDVPGNAPTFFANPQLRTLIGPATGDQRFFRPRLSEP